MLSPGVLAPCIITPCVRTLYAFSPVCSHPALCRATPFVRTLYYHPVCSHSVLSPGVFALWAHSHRLESDEVTEPRESSVCAISSSSPGGPGLSHRLVAVLGRVIPSSPLTPSRLSSAIHTLPPSRDPPSRCKPGDNSDPSPAASEAEVVGNPATDRTTAPACFSSSRESSGDRLDNGSGGGLC